MNINLTNKCWGEIFQRIAHPMFVLDADYSIVEANLAALERTKAPLSQLQGRKCYKLLHGKNEPIEDCPMRGLLHSSHLETVEMVIQALGGVFLVSCTPILNRKSELQKILCIAIDVAWRKLAVEALSPSERQYRHRAENLSDVIYTTDEKGLITYVNPAIESLTGYKQSEVVGRVFTELFHDEHMPRIFKQFQRFLIGYMEPSDHPLLTKRGESRWIRFYGRPIYEEGRVLGLTGLLTDITDQKRLELQRARETGIYVLDCLS